MVAVVVVVVVVVLVLVLTRYGWFGIERELVGYNYRGSLDIGGDAVHGDDDDDDDVCGYGDGKGVGEKSSGVRFVWD